MCETLWRDVDAASSVHKHVFVFNDGQRWLRVSDTSLPNQKKSVFVFFKKKNFYFYFWFASARLFVGSGCPRFKKSVFTSGTLNPEN